MLIGNLAQNQLHILAKSHIQHFIRLVQHHHIYMLKLNGVTTHMIHNASRCTYNDLHSLQAADLLSNLLSPIDGKDLDPLHIFCNFAKLLRRLDRQLSGRAQNNRLKLTQLRIDLLQSRNAKSRRFPGSRLCLSDNIVAIEQIGNRLLLNGR